MKCPHCSIDFHDEWTQAWFGGGDVDHRSYELSHCSCSACKRSIFTLARTNFLKNTKRELVYPKGSLRSIAPEVIEPYASDFREAVEVLPISPNASAALSRRNVQAVLRDVHHVKHSDLSKEIQEFIDRPGTPTGLKDNIDAIRNVGNFAAHPMKDKSTGMILDIEPHEAEWLLDVLEELFDYSFVQPAKSAAKKAAINAKLAAAGKPPMK